MRWRVKGYGKWAKWIDQMQMFSTLLVSMMMMIIEGNEKVVGPWSTESWNLEIEHSSSAHFISSIIKELGSLFNISTIQASELTQLLFLQLPEIHILLTYFHISIQLYTRWKPLNLLGILLNVECWKEVKWRKSWNSIQCWMEQKFSNGFYNNRKKKSLANVHNLWDDEGEKKNYYFE